MKATPKSHQSTFSDMFSGADDEKILANLSLTFGQHLKAIGLASTILLYKFFVLPWKKKKQSQLFSDLDKLKQLSIKLPAPIHPPSSDNYFLDKEDQSFFESNGYLPPFQVISAEQAEKLKNLALYEFENDFQGISYLGDKVKDISKKEGRWTIEYAGLYQALRLKPFRDLLRSPSISERLASLLGDEVIYWRSQFFNKCPGTEGTPWHQNATFREVGKYAKLQPTKDTSPALIQLTVWVALTDSTKETGCLRMIPGSHTDARINYLYDFIQDNKLMYLALVPASPRNLYRLAKLFLFGEIFQKSAILLFSAKKNHW